MEYMQRRWCAAGERTERAVLERLAARLGFDVSSAEGWRRVTNKTLLQEAGGRGLLRRHGSLAVAVKRAFPEHELDEHSCRGRVPNGYWECRERRRAFLEGVAARRGIHSAEGWRQVSHRDIYAEGGKALLARYEWSLMKALADLFPEMEFTHSSCQRVPRGHWDLQENRRAFFEGVRRKYGIGKGSSAWQCISLATLQREGGGGLMASRYANSFWAALRDVYPEVDWKEHEARPTVPQGYWETEENVRGFVLQAARQLRVNSEEEWGRVSREQLKTVTGSQSILAAMSLQEMLQTAFPASEAWRRPALLRKAQQRQLYHQV
eukprot:CAMPEP_0114607168 /NCGR_PEP_ID=MMETSP0168-20121206/1931_1 /TAXON_ID=95228 ORGANISM="Vannella sp., Strain DIVA3 517/6/12" /NCGR_SAMPLE_ID=MMETSP0168 /ASSEMBLY_ACC=CAM_ASM_000044 /LENGTH=321 /DNA_ID=CAMNT_0001818041 /DNA_START=73 /DNA_END=1035 /DNA_ORIENTATION=+